MTEGSHSGPAAGTADEFDATMAKFKEAGLELGDHDSWFTLSESEMKLDRCGSVELKDLVKIKACLIASQMPESDSKMAKELWKIFYALDDKTLVKFSCFMKCGSRNSIREFIRTLLAASQPPACVKTDRLDWKLVRSDFNQETVAKLGIGSSLVAPFCCPHYKGKASTCCFATLLAKEKFKDEGYRNEMNEEDIYNVLYETDEDEVFAAIANYDKLFALVSPLYYSVKGIFDITYEDPHEMVSFLRGYVERAIDIFNKGATGEKKADASKTRGMYSRYVSICQSSGYGKTKLALELCKHFYCIYTCLRDVRSGGDPPRSYIATRFLELKTKGDFTKFYRVFFETFRDYVREGRFDQFSIGSGDFYSKVSRLLSRDSIDGRLFWKRVETASASRETPTSIRETPTSFSELEAMYSAYRDVEKSFSDRGLEFKPFIFVLDEARSMLKEDEEELEDQEAVFIEWQRAVGDMQNNMKLFFILLDTSCRVANFTPASHFNPSSRAFPGGVGLYPPIYLLPTNGVVKIPPSKLRDLKILSHSSGVVEEEVLDRHFQELEYHPLQVLQSCRPLFATILKRYERESEWPVAYKELVTFAKCKLTCQGMLLNDREIDFSIQYMAVLACRLSLHSVDSDTSEYLVSSFMATLIHMNEERSVISSLYVPEPILQEAASSLIHSKDQFVTALEHLSAKIRSGQFEVLASKKESLGELVASVCLLRAYDSLLKVPEGYFMTPHPLADFVQAIVGKKRFVKQSIASMLPKGYVSFSKWYRISSPVTQEILFEAFENRYAIVCRENEVTIDLVIPFVLRPEGKGTFLATVEHMCPLLIQVKNYSNALSELERGDAMNSMNDIGKEFPSSMNIVIQVGSGGMEGRGGKAHHVFVKEAKVGREHRAVTTLMIPSIESLSNSTFSPSVKASISKIADTMKYYDSLEEQYGPYHASIDRVYKHFDGVLRKRVVKRNESKASAIEKPMPATGKRKAEIAKEKKGPASEKRGA